MVGIDTLVQDFRESVLGGLLAILDIFPASKPKEIELTLHIPPEYNRLGTVNSVESLDAVCTLLYPLEQLHGHNQHSDWFSGTLIDFYNENATDLVVRGKPNVAAIQRVSPAAVAVFQQAINNADTYFRLYKTEVIQNLRVYLQRTGGDVASVSDLTPDTSYEIIKSRLPVYLEIAAGDERLLPTMDAHDARLQFKPMHERLERIGRVLKKADWYNAAFSRGATYGRLLV